MNIIWCLFIKSNLFYVHLNEILQCWLWYTFTISWGNTLRWCIIFINRNIMWHLMLQCNSIVSKLTWYCFKMKSIKEKRSAYTQDTFRIYINSCSNHILQINNQPICYFSSRRNPFYHEIKHIGYKYIHTKLSKHQFWRVSHK